MASEPGRGCEPKRGTAVQEQEQRMEYCGERQVAQSDADECGDCSVAHLRYGDRHRSAEASPRDPPIWPAGLRVVRAGRFAGDGRVAEMSRSLALSRRAERA